MSNIIGNIGYSYNDLTIVPATFSHISSRTQCNPFVDNEKMLALIKKTLDSLREKYLLKMKIFYKDLINIYNQMNDGEKVFEIIQVSFDAKEEDFKKAISGLPWKFLPLNFAGINELKKKYNVLTIPKFFPIDKTGKSLSDRGREDLLEYGVDICEKWNEDARVAPDLIYEPNEHGQEQGENQNENNDNGEDL